MKILIVKDLFILIYNNRIQFFFLKDIIDSHINVCVNFHFNNIEYFKSIENYKNNALLFESNQGVLSILNLKDVYFIFEHIQNEHTELSFSMGEFYYFCMQ